jgi:hypothetical protein
LVEQRPFKPTSGLFDFWRVSSENAGTSSRCAFFRVSQLGSKWQGMASKGDTFAIFCQVESPNRMLGSNGPLAHQPAA